MVKLPFRVWRNRPPIFVFMLAVMLPAAALVIASVVYLRHMQRDKIFDNSIKMEYQQTLAIAEKRIDDRAFEIAENAQASFPDVDDTEGLDAFLNAHPDISHAFIWTRKGEMTLRSRPEKMSDPEFQESSKKLAADFQLWFDMDSDEHIAKTKSAEAAEMRHVWITEEPIAQGDKMLYGTFVFFIPRGSSPDHPAIAGFGYDEDYLRNKFFPTVLQQVMPVTGQNDHLHPQLAMTVRKAKEETPLAASICWDGGVPEVERSFSSVFPMLVLGIRPQGTTVADISHHITRIAFMALGALSLLIGAGMIFAYRNVASELALAKLKSDFVSNVSHELRTPLALIRLYAETLELGRISTAGKQQQYYEIIRKESERLTSLINNILDFSRIEAGKKEYSFRETDVADLVRSTLESYRFEIEQNGFEFEQRIDNNLPPLAVDREAIARSLLNLVNNAVKYSAGRKYLGVNLYRRDGNVNLEVEDHGIGIPPKEQCKIFDKFYRVGDPLVHNTKGSGLGLSLVRHIVLAHGGQVAVESAPGRGSKFIIILPVQNSALQQVSI
jgi:signal transduction histidine kinase